MEKREKKKIILAGKRGFCSGVKNALSLVEKVLAEDPEKKKKIFILEDKRNK